MYPTFSGTNNGTGQFSPPIVTRATFRQPNAGSLNTAFASITKGQVCIFDLYQRGAYSTRASAGATPDYGVSNVSSQADGNASNVTVIDSAGTEPPTTRCGAAILADATLAAGSEGNFYVAGGPVQALCSGAVAKGNRLGLDASGTGATVAGRLRVAVIDDTVYAVAQETIAAAGLCWVQMVPPHQATTAGTA